MNIMKPPYKTLSWPHIWKISNNSFTHYCQYICPKEPMSIQIAYYPNLFSEIVYAPFKRR